MSNYVLCDLCHMKLGKKNSWWKEHYIVAANAEHVFSDGYSADELTTSYDLCPNCWDTFIKLIRGKEVSL